jgi:thiamine-monophosphate kinase
LKLSRLGEFGLIDAIRRTAPTGKGVRIGIGDDCAWVEHATGSSLITADLLIEGIHFDLRWTSLDALGHKSLAVNLSDIAAMGGAPKYVILSLGIPGKFDSTKIAAFYRGFNRLARRSGVALVGGDTNLAESLIISVCLIGDPPARPVRRSGASIGDDIYVTGTLGDAALGLRFLRKRTANLRSVAVSRLLRRHHLPTPRLSLGHSLAELQLATAMIDLSDGLLQDLGHICHASGVGAEIRQERLPLSRAFRRLAGQESAGLALSGGEDYELLFCARPSRRERIGKLSARQRLRISRIGRVVGKTHGVTVLDRSARPVEVDLKGHDHFKN